jgi:hypothetical protein
VLCEVLKVLPYPPTVLQPAINVIMNFLSTPFIPRNVNFLDDEPGGVLETHGLEKMPF